jgi:hypothetical protein
MIPFGGWKLTLEGFCIACTAMATQRQRSSDIQWPKETELVGLEFSFVAEHAYELYPALSVKRVMSAQTLGRTRIFTNLRQKL